MILRNQLLHAVFFLTHKLISKAGRIPPKFQKHDYTLASEATDASLIDRRNATVRHKSLYYDPKRFEKARIYEDVSDTFAQDSFGANFDNRRIHQLESVLEDYLIHDASTNPKGGHQQKFPPQKQKHNLDHIDQHPIEECVYTQYNPDDPEGSPDPKLVKLWMRSWYRQGKRPVLLREQSRVREKMDVQLTKGAFINQTKKLPKNDHNLVKRHYEDPGEGQQNPATPEKRRKGRLVIEIDFFEGVGEGGKALVGNRTVVSVQEQKDRYLDDNGQLKNFDFGRNRRKVVSVQEQNNQSVHELKNFHLYQNRTAEEQKDQSLNSSGRFKNLQKEKSLDDSSQSNFRVQKDSSLDDFNHSDLRRNITVAADMRRKELARKNILDKLPSFGGQFEDYTDHYYYWREGEQRLRGELMKNPPRDQVIPMEKAALSIDRQPAAPSKQQNYDLILELLGPFQRIDRSMEPLRSLYPIHQRLMRSTAMSKHGGGGGGGDDPLGTFQLANKLLRTDQLASRSILVVDPLAPMGPATLKSHRTFLQHLQGILENIQIVSHLPSPREIQQQSHTDCLVIVLAADPRAQARHFRHHHRNSHPHPKYPRNPLSQAIFGDEDHHPKDHGQTERLDDILSGYARLVKGNIDRPNILFALTGGHQADSSWLMLEYHLGFVIGQPREANDDEDDDQEEQEDQRSFGREDRAWKAAFERENSGDLSLYPTIQAIFEQDLERVFWIENQLDRH